MTNIGQVLHTVGPVKLWNRKTSVKLNYDENSPMKLKNSAMYIIVHCLNFIT